MESGSINEEDEMILLLKKIAEDIRSVKAYARFQARDAITVVLSKIATTPDRQQMWRLADGSLSNDQISKQVGVTLRSVQYFVQEAESAGLFVTEKRGYPKRVEDVFPIDWKTWKPKKSEEKPQDTEVK
jgi:hypothetical protein